MVNEPRADGGYQKCIGRDGVGGIFAQRNCSQDAVKSISDTRANAKQQSNSSNSITGDARNKNAPGKRQGESNDFLTSYLFVKKYRRHQHNPNGRGVQEYRRRGKGHNRDGRKIADCKEQYAPDAKSQE